MSTVQLETINHVIGGQADRRRVDAHRARLRPRDRPGAAARAARRGRPTSTPPCRPPRPRSRRGATSSVMRRARVMFAFRELVVQHTDELARIISAEHGKTFEDAKGEVIRGMEVVEFACGIAELTKGEFSDQVSTDVDLHSFRQPLGVCAGITPFNFPIMVPMWMHPMAIATGNTFVLKPSERDPSVSNLIAELYARGGAAGRRVQRRARRQGRGRRAARPSGRGGDQLRRLDADREVHPRARDRERQARAGARRREEPRDRDARRRSGLRRQPPDRGRLRLGRPALHGDLASPSRSATPPTSWSRSCARRRSAIKVGPGLDPDSEMGPLVTGAARDRIVDYIGRGEGDVVVDGRELEIEGDGFWVGPTLIDNVTHRHERLHATRSSARCSPSCASTRSTRRSSSSTRNTYANGTAIFTTSGHAAREFQRRIQVGMIGVNVPIPVPMGFYSFGGWKDSLFGDHHIHGPEGVKFYTRAKVVTTRWPESPRPRPTCTSRPAIVATRGRRTGRPAARAPST